MEGVAAQQTALVALSDLGSAAGKSRALSEGLWGRAFLTAYNSASDGERLRMAEGLGKGAGLALLAVPMADAFDFTQSQFQRILSNYLGLDGAISIPHTHHCGGGVTRVLTQGTVNHLQVWAELGPTQRGPRCAVTLGSSKRSHQRGCSGDSTYGWRRRHLRCGRGLLRSILQGEG